MKDERSKLNEFSLPTFKDRKEKNQKEEEISKGKNESRGG